MNKLFDWLIYALTIGGIYTLSRPGSQGPQLLNAAGNTFVHVTQAATGQTIK